jgi:Glycine cleavage H-protein
MKTIIGNIWTEVKESGLVKVGFTQQFIEQRLGECFHVMQADVRQVKKGEPMLVIETTDGLESLKAPLSGSIHFFNVKARNFPDRLNEEDLIMELLPDGVVLPVVKKKKVIDKFAFLNDLESDLFQITPRGQL